MRSIQSKNGQDHRTLLKIRLASLSESNLLQYSVLCESIDSAQSYMYNIITVENLQIKKIRQNGLFLGNI